MKNRFSTTWRTTLALVTVAFFTCLPMISSADVKNAQAAPPSSGKKLSLETANDNSFYGKFIRNRLSIGVKCSTPSLDNPDRPPKSGDGFIGHVNHLEDGDMTTALSLEYQICDYLRFEFSNYEISATTINYNNNLTDGDVVMDGPYVGLKLQLPLFDGIVIPYVSGGWAFLSGDFEEAYWWHQGWSSEKSWQSMGSPHKKRTPYNREIYVEDSTEFIYGFGLTLHLFDRLELEGFMNFCDANPACEYGYTRHGDFDKHQDGDFDLTNYQVGFCARLVF